MAGEELPESGRVSQDRPVPPRVVIDGSELLAGGGLADDLGEGLELEAADDEMKVGALLVPRPLGRLRRHARVRLAKLRRRRLDPLLGHVVGEEPVELLVEERRELRAVVLDVARVEREHGVAVGDDAGRDDHTWCGSASTR